MLKKHNLIQHPAFEVMTAKEKFDHPRMVNEIWQTDYTQFQVMDWGMYDLSTAIDDYSRYILACLLSPTMNAGEAKDTLTIALEKVGIERVKLQNYYSPAELERLIGDFVEYDNRRCYHEALENVTLADVYYGSNKEFL